MNLKFKRIVAAAASLAIAATSNLSAASLLTADAAYGVGGNGAAIMEYLDRGIYAIKSGDGMFVSWRFNANDDDNAEFQLFRDDQLIYTSKAGDTAGRNIAAKAILKRVKESEIAFWGGGLHHELFYVLRNTVAPALLIEHGFHTNKTEVELLKSNVYRDKLAAADAKGILDYLGIAWQEPPKVDAQPEDGGAYCPHCGGKLKIEKG